MSCIMFENGLLFSDSKSSPPPYQDYHQILVSKSEVIFRTWKVTPRKVKAAPNETKVSHNDFPHNRETKNDIKRVFGGNILDYVCNLTRGQIDYLPRMPEKILLKIISYLDLGDYINISQTSSIFHKLCKHEDLWEKLFYRHHKMAPCSELKELAAKTNWKHLTFCNILQLRVQLLKHMKSKAGTAEESGYLADESADVNQNFSTISLKRAIGNGLYNSSKRIEKFMANNSNTTSLENTYLMPCENKNFIKPAHLKPMISRTSSYSESSKGLRINESITRNEKLIISEAKSQAKLSADTDRVLFLSAKGRLDRKQEKKRMEVKDQLFTKCAQEDSINSH